MKRRIIQVAVLLVLSAIVNVTVAWGFAARRASTIIERNVHGHFVLWDRPWQVVLERKFGMIDVWWYDLHYELPRSISSAEVVANASAHRNERQASGRKLPSGRAVETLASIPMWGTFGGEPLPADIIMGGDIAFGVPCASLWFSTTCDVVANTTTNVKLHGAWQLDGQPASRGNRFVALPYRVIWPGFAINTILYAAVLWMIFIAPFALRRRLRARRGLCRACAYPIGSSPVCTECGAALTGRSNV